MVSFKWCIDIVNGEGKSRLPVRRGVFKICVLSCQFTNSTDELFFININSPNPDIPTYFSSGKIFNCVKIVPFSIKSSMYDFSKRLEFYTVNFTDTDIIDVEVVNSACDSRPEIGIIVFYLIQID